MYQRQPNRACGRPRLAMTGALLAAVVALTTPASANAQATTTAAGVASRLSGAREQFNPHATITCRPYRCRLSYPLQNLPCTAGGVSIGHAIPPAASGNKRVWDAVGETRTSGGAPTSETVGVALSGSYKGQEADILMVTPLTMLEVYGVTDHIGSLTLRFTGVPLFFGPRSPYVVAVQGPAVGTDPHEICPITLAILYFVHQMGRVTLHPIMRG